MNEILIVGAGIGGLTLALELHAKGIPCRIFEAAPEVRPLGVGINIQPYATEVFARLGVLEALASCSVTTREFVFFSRHGQEVYRSHAGRYAGHGYPQLSIHRGELQMTLLNAVIARLGEDRVMTGHKCTGFSQNAQFVTANFENSVSGETLPQYHGAALVGADGIHSAIYKQLYPTGPQLRYSGTNMWRGTSLWPGFLSGASMVRIGLPEHGKMVIYPIRHNVGGKGLSLVNWVVELDTANYNDKATNLTGRIEDFAAAFADWRFDWLDVPALISNPTGKVLEFPMMDRDPLEKWNFGRVTLMGDAAHPMVPLGSNGAGQAILDGAALARHLSNDLNVEQALTNFDAERRPYTSNIVLGDRRGVVDEMVKEVHARTNGERFNDLSEIISVVELNALAVPNYHAGGLDRLAA